ncbi:MAG: two-component system sensor histidine kinase CreC [Propionivibrio sp.]|nr:two-component system sensor histidine kinase CreC [Propionivibrio sp.]
MKLWARVFIGYFLIVGLSGWFLLRVFISEVKPGVRDAVEDVMVDTAQLLAELARDDLLAKRLPNGRFAQSVEAYRQRPIKATIWGLEKQTLDFRIYVTDAAGVVRYDSEHKAVGGDYSDWRDVSRTLRGEYGSRATRDDPDDKNSSVMHVAAAVKDDGEIIGVVTVAKPSRTLGPIIERSERTVLRQGLLLLGVTLLIGGAFTTWLTVSMSRLVRYARLLAAGCPAEPPSRGRDEIGELSRALAQLRNEIDGRAYVEHYVQHLTHEMKSPLAAIHGAAELLAETDLPEAERNRFVANVLTQSERMQSLIDKLLRLAQIEQQRELEAPATFKVQELFADLEQAMSAHAERRNVKLTFTADPVAQLSGDRFLLSLALTNLIQNALDFSPSGGTVTCMATGDDRQIHFAVHDQGPGIPEFADQRIFERFFSLPRPDGTPKSTGLGLPLVNEIAMLHGGAIRLENAVDGGALATLSIPLHGHGQAT